MLEDGTDKLGPFGHGWTYSAHPICAAAGVANLKLIDDLKLVDNARDIGAYLNRSMQEALAEHPHVGDIRGEGLLCAIEFVEDKASRQRYEPLGAIAPQLATAVLGHNMIGRAMPGGDILGFAPPLCINKEEIDTLVDATVKAVDEVYG